MVKQERAARTRQALVRAAAQVFAQDGFVLASLTSISKKAGVSNGALHFHFESKQALARAVEEEAVAVVRAIVAPADGGSPVYLQCLISTADTQVIDTWTTTGMRGTGSHDYAVTDLFVPAEHVHGAVTDCHRPQPLYQFVGWTHIAHAALGLAIARVAIDELIGMAGAKKGTWMSGEGQLAGRTTIQAKVAQAEALVGSGRAYVREATADM